MVERRKLIWSSLRDAMDLIESSECREANSSGRTVFIGLIPSPPSIDTRLEKKRRKNFNINDCVFNYAEGSEKINQKEKFQKYNQKKFYMSATSTEITKVTSLLMYRGII